MKSLTLVSVVLAVLLVISSTSVSALSSAPKFELNLDLPPAQRWNGAVEKILQRYTWKESFGPVIDLYGPLTWVIPKSILADVESVMLAKFPELLEEQKGIYEQLDKYGNISKMMTLTGYRALLSVAYEAEHLNELFDMETMDFYKRACTGILSLPVDKTQDVIHARNMDEDPLKGRFLTLDITATRNGKTVWTAVDWLWITSSPQTSSSSKLTMELNYRNCADSQNPCESKLSLAGLLSRIKEPNFVPVLLLHRYVHDIANMTFAQFLFFSENTANYGASFYTVSSGPNRQGALLTLHHDRKLTRVIRLNDTTVDEKTGQPVYWMVQTNYDVWRPDPKSDPRRTVAQDTLTMLGQNLPGRDRTEIGLWMAISTFPVHNQHTMYTALMSVSKPIEGYVRRDMEPGKM